MRSGVRRARRRTAAASALRGGGGGQGGQGGEGALRDAEAAVPTRDDVEAGLEDDAPRALEADAAVLGGLASGAGRRAVAEVADDVRSQITARSVDGARTPSQQALRDRRERGLDGHVEAALRALDEVHEEGFGHTRDVDERALV